MRQIVQNLKTGETLLENVPVPKPGRGQLLIRTTRSLVSLGTERMLVEFGKANWLQKARQQPDKVIMVLDKVKAEGLKPTLETIFNRLDTPLPLGYSSAGVVVETGPDVPGFRIGDHVASNGPHAEFVCVARNLAAGIPQGVSDDAAAFTALGAIGLQGIRLCGPSLGETVVVMGMGLIGLMTAQLLAAHGCRVIGIDPDRAKTSLAGQWGIITFEAGESDVVRAVMEMTGQAGADAVIITASAKTDDIVAQAARMSRKRGRIVLIGVVGLGLNRADFYEKELTFQVSCSYGPGRYDEAYEQRGLDYPVGFVRWTEKRNFEAVLNAMASGRLSVEPLIKERVELEDYRQIYDHLGQTGSIASILVYPESKEQERSVSLASRAVSPGKSAAIIGAGNFTKMTLLPAVKKCGMPIRSISSASGLSGAHLAKKYAIPMNTTDYREILQDPDIGLVLITTRHDLHAKMAVECLNAGKDVFVEKPLALTREEFQAVKQAYQASSKSLTVGFNRRFSPHTQALKKALGGDPGPLNLTATMNAGFIPPSVWVHDREVGGGRIIGEACHYLDVLAYLAGSRIEAVCMNALGSFPRENTDNASILIRFANGSLGVVNYFSNGNKAYPKERIEVYGQGRVAVIDNFRRTTAFGFPGLKRLRTCIDKGHSAQFRMLNERLAKGGQALVPFADIENVTLASFAAIESLKCNEWVKL
jgi:predicted dehydrogenase/threonine dehydrogenase-like Zn-dependent dehydrogenase